MMSDSPSRVLLVEDDMRLSKVVVDYLEMNGLVCDHAESGERALALVKTNTYDLIVTDVNMDKVSGFELCRRLRENLFDIPIILLTSRASIYDKETGFKLGADDYIAKPFELKELLLRIEALLKRVNGRLSKLVLEELGLEIDISSRRVIRDKQEIELSKSGWKLLLALAKAWPNPVSKGDLEYALWGDAIRESDGLKAHIRLLRIQVDKSFDTPIIKTVPNFGYLLERVH